MYACGESRDKSCVGVDVKHSGETSTVKDKNGNTCAEESQRYRNVCDVFSSD